MSRLQDPIRVVENYFWRAGKGLSDLGLIYYQATGRWGGEYRCSKTGKPVATYTDMVTDPSLHIVERGVFESVTVEGYNKRALTGTEYEMICRRLEGQNEIHLPPWTYPIYERAVRDGLRSFRGLSAFVTVPYTMTLAQAAIPSAAPSLPTPARALASQA